MTRVQVSVETCPDPASTELVLIRVICGVMAAGGLVESVEGYLSHLRDISTTNDRVLGVLTDLGNDGLGKASCVLQGCFTVLTAHKQAEQQFVTGKGL